MSRVTNPEKESSVSCGFYNSLNDRKYDAVQMSKLFDGIINDGVFASIGTCFVVNADSGNMVNVGIGKAWFNHTWTENDAILPVECEESEVLLDRIDAVVLEIDATETVRDNFIKYIKGTPSSSPERPIMTHTSNVNQYALCYIRRTAGSTEIRQADITNMIGSEETPFVTGLMQTISLSELMGQWEDELDQFIEMEEADFSEWYQLMKDVLQEKADDLDEWSENEKASFLAWFQGIKGQLDEDAAGNLQNQIDRKEVERILMIGLVDGEKIFSEDGTSITSTDTTGRTLTKTFTPDFSKCTTELKNAEGSVIGTMIKTFGSDGKTIDTTVSIM